MIGLLATLLAWHLAPAQELSPNLALNQPATASSATWPGFPASFINDGSTATFSHPLAATGTSGFHFQIDLGRVYRLERIVLRNREDGCCPERLSQFGIELYADAEGEPGTLNWSSTIRPDGSHSGVGGMDTVTAAAHPTGTFAGRFVRVVNRSGAAYNPQLSEIEVYGGLTPVIRTFTAEPDVVAPGEPVTLRWNVERAMNVSLLPVPGALPTTNGFLIVHPTSTTTYILTATNEAGTTQAQVNVGVGVTLLPPRITEFVADNANGLDDEDGDSSDWIELENPNPYSLDLGGLHLTDAASNRTKWRFPSLRIPPGGFLVVFASGKDRSDPAGFLHTNFRLAADGEYLALVDRDGLTVLDQFPPTHPNPRTFPSLGVNISHGYGSAGNLGFMRPPTPGTTNGPAFDGIVADPVPSHAHGLSDQPFNLTLLTSTPGAVIRYTTNTTLPTPTSGSVYSQPIPITRTTVLRFAAFREGWAPTRVHTASYIFPSNVLASSVMRTSITRNPIYQPQLHAALLDLPSISLVTPTAYNDLREEPSSIEWLDPSGDPGFQENCAVRKFGGAFTDFAKDSFRVYFRGQYGATKLRYPLFAGHDHGLEAVEEFDQIELRSGSHDMVERGFYMSNIFTDDTLLDLGQLNPHGRFVHLYINGTYWGLYHLRERWGASMHREYLGGSKEDYESINGNWNVGGWADPGVPYDGDGSVWSHVKNRRGSFTEVAPWVDLPQYTDYMLTFLFGGSEEEYRCVGPNVPGSGFKFYLNDADGWLCVPNYCASGDRTARGAPGRQNGDGPGSLFSMLLKENHPDFRMLVADRFHRALTKDGALTPAQNAARLLARTTPIERAFITEAARWGYLNPVEWASRRDHVLQNWFPTRTAEAINTFRNAGFLPEFDPPTPVPAGGPLAAGTTFRFNGPPGAEIFYTLDGSDPRAPGGGLNPNARRYETSSRTTTLVPAGSTWKWHTDAVGLGSSAVVEGAPDWSDANWKHPGFPDTNWPEGPAQLGYGEGDERTLIPFGPNPSSKWMTIYFRKHFVVQDLASLQSLTLRLLRDDGAIVYLNGREVLRSSIRSGAVVGVTPADGAPDDGQSFNSFPIPASALLPGENLLAVELHQASPTSSDASFDLELNANITNANPGDPNLRIDRNTLVRSRARIGNNWSALDETFFQTGSAVEPGSLAITELHYHPAGDRDAEFVELTNISDHALNLRGVRFTDGIEFSFPDQRNIWIAPGRRLVLVRDLFRFQQRYGRDVTVDGIYSGRLADDGERLALVDGSGSPLLDFEFPATPGSPIPPIGHQNSLVLIDPALDPNLPSSWRPSAVVHGTPGEADSIPFSGDPLADLDHDGVPAILEYVFGSSDTDPASGPGLVRAGPVIPDWITLEFPHRPGTDSAIATVEYSPDLRSWLPATRLSIEPQSEGILREVWGVPTLDRPTLFLRLHVQW